jgi:hypothetical protein
MLRHMLGDEVFWAGVREYVKRCVGLHTVERKKVHRTSGRSSPCLTMCVVSWSPLMACAGT